MLKHEPTGTPLSMEEMETSSDRGCPWASGADGWLRADWAVDPTTGRSRVSVTWASCDG